ARKSSAGATGGRRRIALAQVEPVLGDLAANVDLHLRWARRALRERADLVVFPELSLTGYLLKDLVTDVAVRLADPAPLRPLFQMSRRIALAFGLVEETAGHRYHNSAVLLEAGRVRHVHRKVYLPTYGMFDEGRYFAAGDRLEAFPATLGRLGMLICEDLWHTSSALVLAQDGADYILALSNGPTQGVDAHAGLSNQATWRDVVKVTAQLQTVFVAWVNRVGFEDGVNFGGGSCVVDPFGRTLAEGKLLEEDLVVCDLERSTLRHARTVFPLLRDERLPVLSREIGRLLAVPATGRAARRP
ncbi:MAG TPA: nitrilase-related carbon-nitrogen hydrolase, partial [Candidatus Polarisedimenticolia bacterium]|nr:nitrilase-related carbon-nitrogen hydrolase [Candidatus Polarisedimenticolia bacterium]